MRLNKRAAEESNVIIFIILALAVACLVIYFSWNFFGTGIASVNAGDPTVQIALESCRVEIARQPQAYCSSAKYVKMTRGGEMVASCEYIDKTVRPGEVSAELTIPTTSCVEATFINNQCEIAKATLDEKTAKELVVNGKKCSDNETVWPKTEPKESTEEFEEDSTEETPAEPEQTK